MKSKLTPNGEPLLIHISNFRPLKRVSDVLDIFSIIRSKRTAKLAMIGDGPEMPMAQKKAAQLGLLDDTYFLGRQDSVASILAASDVMLFPSCCESFGLAALEALSCGVPVIATNAGGIPEVIEHGEVGFLANVGEVEEMAQYTLELLDNQRLRQKISLQAREHALKRFNAGQWVAKYEQIYQSF
nr:glycosyltransferase [Desulforamulus aquiferis]